MTNQVRGAVGAVMPGANPATGSPIPRRPRLGARPLLEVVLPARSRVPRPAVRTAEPPPGHAGRERRGRRAPERPAGRPAGRHRADARRRARPSFGVWVGVGSRDETPRLAGASHFLEHLLFKGTKRRDALEIAAVDGRGRRRDERLHRQGVHLLLRAGARRRPAARGRRRLRHGHVVAADERRRRERAGRDPRGDRHARRRPGRRRARRVRRRAVRRPPARPARHRHASRASRALSRAPLDGFWRRRYAHPRRRRRGGRRPRPRRGRRAGRARRFGARPATAAPGAAAAAPTGRRRRCRASSCERRPSEQANLVLGVPGAAPRRPAPLRARRCCRARSAAA